MRSLFASIALCALLGSNCSDAADYDRRMVLRQAAFLCDWAPANIDLSANPMSFCGSLREWALEGYGFEKIDVAVKLWWVAWINHDPAQAAQNLRRFDDAFTARQRDLQLEAQGRSPAQLAKAARGAALAKNAASMSPDDLCSLFSTYRTGAFRQELERRKVISAGEWEFIEEERLAIGMSELALVCAWGRPDRVDRTVEQSNERKTHIYGEHRFVRTANGKVIAFQD